MFKAAFAEKGIEAEYVRLASPDCESALRILGDMGADGFNATSPYKEALVPFMASLDRAAEETGAVNTVVRKGDQWFGHNTDVAGASHALASARVRVKGSNAVVLGTGGAARAAVVALLADGAEVTVAGRNAAKAKAISREFGCASAPLKGATFEKALQSSFVVVGSLSTAERVVNAKLLRRSTAVLDANYRSETALAKDAWSRGCKVIDGREWLAHQGAEAFRIFFGEKAPLTAMRAAAFDDDSTRRQVKSEGKRGVVLTGFMASGKTSTGKALAKRLKRPFADTDAMAEAASGSSIAEIFKFGGERGFRALERGAIKDASVKKGAVVATGGGAVLDARNVELMKGIGHVVLLWVDAATAASRDGGSGKRPLIGGPSSLAAVRKLLADRERAYFASCDLVVDSRAPLKEVVEVVAHEVR
jgi:shikimate dehydrogenase